MAGKPKSAGIRLAAGAKNAAQMLKRPRFEGELGRRSSRAINKLISQRSERKKDTLHYAACTALGSASANAIAPALGLTARREIEHYAVAATVGAPIGAFFGYTGHSKKIREATHNILLCLHDEAKTNKPLVQFLKRFEYIFIDRKGRITGTNFSAAGLGRLRIKTDDILYGEKAA